MPTERDNAAEAYALAQLRISNARKRGEAKLDLAIRGLESIPPLLSLPELQFLDLSRTQISNLGPLSDLTALVSLDLNRAQISKLGPLERLTGLQSLDLSRTQISDLTPLADLSRLQSLQIGGTQVTNIVPLARLIALQLLNIGGTQVSNLSPLAGLSALQVLDIGGTQVSDVAPLSRLKVLQLLNLAVTPISDITSIAGLTALESVNLRRTNVSELAALNGLTSLHSLNLVNTQVSSLEPLFRLTKLIDGALSNIDAGLNFSDCPLTDQTLLALSKINNPQRTIRTINYLRELQGLPPYSRDSTAPLQKLNVVGPKPLESVPAPFDFALTERGTIALAGSDTNVPAFPFPTSSKDHAERLHAARALADDVIAALSGGKYNVRSEFLDYLRKYSQRLPQGAKDGNMLLADAMARALHDLFAADAEILSPGFASLLSSFLKQHIGLCAYYPEVGTFNRDIRDGQLSRPFPLRAVQAFTETVQEYTPTVFEPPVSQAISDAQNSSPPAPAPAIDAPPPSPQTILPPPNPGGDIDPTKSREFATASTANRLWKVVQAGGEMGRGAAAWIAVTHALGPSVAEIINWLAHFLASIG